MQRVSKFKDSDAEWIMKHSHDDVSNMNIATLELADLLTTMFLVDSNPNPKMVFLRSWNKTMTVLRDIKANIVQNLNEYTTNVKDNKLSGQFAIFMLDDVESWMQMENSLLDRSSRNDYINSIKLAISYGVWGIYNKSIEETSKLWSDVYKLDEDYSNAKLHFFGAMYAIDIGNIEMFKKITQDQNIDLTGNLKKIPIITNRSTIAPSLTLLNDQLEGCISRIIHGDNLIAYEMLDWFVDLEPYEVVVGYSIINLLYKSKLTILDKDVRIKIDNILDLLPLDLRIKHSLGGVERSDNRFFDLIEGSGGISKFQKSDLSKYINIAIVNGRLNVVKFLYTQKFDNQLLMDLAMSSNSTIVVDWLQELDVSIGYNAIAICLSNTNENKDFNTIVESSPEVDDLLDTDKWLYAVCTSGSISKFDIFFKNYKPKDKLLNTMTACLINAIGCENEKFFSHVLNTFVDNVDADQFINFANLGGFTSLFEILLIQEKYKLQFALIDKVESIQNTGKNHESLNNFYKATHYCRLIHFMQTLDVNGVEKYCNGFDPDTNNMLKSEFITVHSKVINFDGHVFDKLISRWALYDIPKENVG